MRDIAKLDGKTLIIRLPLQEPEPSKSSRTTMVLLARTERSPPPRPIAVNRSSSWRTPSSTQTKSADRRARSSKSWILQMRRLCLANHEASINGDLVEHGLLLDRLWRT